MKLPREVPPNKFHYAIDPGISGTGVAAWTDEGWRSENPVPPFYAYNIYANISAKSSSERRASIAEKLAPIFDQALSVTIEKPQFYAGGTGAAAAKEGSLVELTLFVGSLIEIARSRDILVRLVTPSTWKGQLSKDQINRRLEKRIGKLPAKSHACDAIGIGLFTQGHLGSLKGLEIIEPGGSHAGGVRSAPRR